MYVGCIVLRYPMSLISPTSNSSASVALRLLTDAAARQSSPTTGAQLKGLTGTLNSASLKATTPSNGTKIILSLAAAEQAYGPDSPLMELARGRADSVQIEISKLPEDKNSFKSEVLNFLSQVHVNDGNFMAALRAGKVVVHTVDEVPEMNFQPMISFNMLKDGNAFGGGVFTPKGFNWELFDKQEAFRGQDSGAIGMHQFYAYYSK